MKKDDLKRFKLPDGPGVYLFKNGRGILYIGKAASLRDRVRSYFSKDLEDARSPAVAAMVEKATSVAWQETASVLEALILEANLIKKHEPKYNIDQKDNKSWNYLVITKEKYPRVLVLRGRELFQKWHKADIKYLFGPFPHGGQLREALKIVRRIFPFRDKCMPEVAKPCFNRQIGLCPGVCSNEMIANEYAESIGNVKDLFSGKFKGLKQKLAREMKVAARAEKYERAEVLRKQVAALEHVRDVSLIGDGNRIATGGGIRIEAYDVAHTGGRETVAVMTVVAGGEPARSGYRMFKIESATNDDTAALQEALTRRLKHPEWPLPRVFVVDGGKGQVNMGRRLLKEAGLEIPVVGVVKNQFHKPERLIGEAHVIAANERDILLANSESHRFAITWHRKRRGKLVL